MFHPVLSSLRSSWRGLYARGKEILSADQITRLSWARRVENYTAVPEVYHSTLDSILTDPSKFPGGILTPTFRGFLHEENERLVLRLEDCLYIFERQKEQIGETIFPLNEIDYVEKGAILLSAWLTLCGREIKGELRRVTLKYNSVTERLFYPLVEAARRASAPPASESPAPSVVTRAAIDALEPHSLKFRNFARRSLLPGEQIQACIFQTEIRRASLEALGRVWLHRRLCPTHLCLLTGSELIMICDDPYLPRGIDQQPYGGIWTFIPRRRITSIVTEPAPGDCLRLSITMCGGSTVETLFAASQRDQLSKITSI